MASTWRSLPCKISELRLDITLDCGQSFRWKEIQPGTWRSVLANTVWTLQQNDHEILYQVHSDSPPILDSVKQELCLKEEHGQVQKQNTTVKKKPKTKQTLNDMKQEDMGLPNMKEEKGDDTNGDGDTILKDYFQLHVNLEKLYKTWKAADANFNKVSRGFPGVRKLRQDPTENLFSFICSSNNNIPRITAMVEKLCSSYGEKLAVVDGTPWYAFPSVKSLACNGVEQELRDMGFGYRAKFINQTAKFIEKQPEGWLEGLRRLGYEEAHAELVKLPGVGAKVADCVCLMSLDKADAIPVDTHVWQIASRDYMPSLNKTKSLTDKVYKEVGHFFRNLFGEYAGWAHSVLFSADLKKFQTKTEQAKSPVIKRNKKQDSGDTKRVKTETNGGKDTKKKR